jgi:hypothetical protein
VKYDSGGNVLWAKSAGGTDTDYGSSVSVNASGNAYLTGYFSSPTITFDSFTLTNVMADYYYDLFLAKLESIFVGIDKVNNSLNISVYPNPATEKIMVVIPKGKNGSYITIFNIEGQELFQQEINATSTIIDVGGLKSGIYFVKVVGIKGIQLGKFIKQ